MAKKSKDPKNKNPNPKSDQISTIPDSSNIFNKLFGEIPESAEPSTSLFSSDNPFRRKPPILENPKNGEVGENPKNGEVGNASDVAQMEKKKNKHKRDILDENAGKPTKELKRDDGQKGDLEMGNGLGLGVNLEEKEGKKKNKRKRDELERDYEVKKYGEVPEEAVVAPEEKVVAGKKRKAVDNPAEMMVSNEGYDDESKLLRTVFVGNLPLKMKKKGLLKEFSKFGEVESIRIRSVPTLDSKKPKKVQIINKNINEAADSIHAYIVFKTEQSAEASLAHNMSMVGGNHIRVDRACPPRKKLKGDEAPLYNNKRTVFVGNLPFDVKDEELYQLFCGIKQLESTVEAVRVIRDPQTSLGKGIAYVMFKTREAANFVCKKRTLKIRDRELRISHSKSETQSTTTPSKRKNPFPVDQEKTPVKKLTPGSTRTPESRYKVTIPGDTSYQGVHATKSGVEKKRTPVRSARPVASSRSTSGTKTKDKVKQRSDKRPSVAARKVKANALLSRGTSGGSGGPGGGSNLAGTKKRKMDARTPQSSNHKKKQAKKFQGRAK